MVGLRLRPSWRLAALALLIGAAALAWRPAEAIDTGVSAPAPAGTVWRIVGGYNTGTHYGLDPYAIDIVREDAPTAGTLVMAPIRGVISWRDASCLTINDGTGNAVLICHMFPADTATVGVQVRRGDYLGTVAPEGYAENNGLSHLHLAVHRTLGAGQIQESLPFSGPYALEGVNLVASSAPNAHGDHVFTSTTVPPPAETQPAAAPPPEPAPAPAPAEEPVVAFLQPGWNLVGWTVDALVDQAIAPIADSVGAVFAYDGPTQSFLRYDPAAPSAFNSLAALPAGAAAFVYVDEDTPLDWALPASPTELEVGLSAGFNLVSWLGGPTSIADATAGLGNSLIAIHAWDAGAQRYQSFRPNLPPELNALASLQPGQALWIELSAAGAWTQTIGEAEAAPAAEGTEGEPAQSTEEEPPPPGSANGEPAATDGGTTAAVAWVRGPGCLNLRTVPTVLDNTPITCVDAGTQVTLLGPTANDENGALWRQTQVGALTGWMFAFYLHLGDDPNAEGGVIGDATYYHPSLAGLAMYCGGIYDPGDPTMAAATSWGCGAKLRVWAGGAYIDVVVRDTGLLGPFHVDLSEAGFAQLAPLGEGRIEVRIEVLEPAP